MIFHGTKILLKGNHDYWWNTVSKMDKFLCDNNINTIKFLYNNSYLFGDYIICGTRGWIDSNLEDDIKIIKREILRLELSLKDGIERFGKDKKIIVNMHYPPFLENVNFANTDEMNFIDLMNKYKAEYCIYGHIHGKVDEEIKRTPDSNINFKLVSCDFLNFKLFKVI